MFVLGTVFLLLFLSMCINQLPFKVNGNKLHNLDFYYGHKLFMFNLSCLNDYS